LVQPIDILFFCWDFLRDSLQFSNGSKSRRHHWFLANDILKRWQLWNLRHQT